MNQGIDRRTRKRWAVGVLGLAAAGAAATALPSPYSLVLLVAGMAAGVLALEPHWTLIALLLLRSSADAAQEWFTLFPGHWYSVNGAGLFNVAAVGVACFVLARRFARGRSLLPSAPLQWYGLFLIITALGLPLSIDGAASIKAWARLAGAFGIALLAAEAVSSPQHEKRTRTIGNAILLAALPPLAVGFYQVATGGGRFFPGFESTAFAYRPQGTFAHPAALASFLILVACLALALPPPSTLRRLALAAASLALAVLTFARAEWAAALAALAVLGTLRARRLLLAAGVSAAVLVLAVPAVRDRLQGQQAGESWEWRQSVWTASLEALRRPTWLGTGLDTSPLLINQRLPSVLTPPHNDYLRVAMESGVIGIAVFLVWQLVTAGHGLRVAIRRRGTIQGALGLTLLAMTAAGLTAGVADNYLGYTSVQWYVWTLAGMLAEWKSTATR